MPSRQFPPAVLASRAGVIVPLEQIQAESVPMVDTAELLRKAETRDLKIGNGVFRFAEALDVEITPNDSGVWETLPDGSSIWRARLNSPGAQSLNLGFLRYEMPEGGKLSIFPPDLESERPYREFTATDNEDHGQLWTPIFRGDELALEVVLPAGVPRDQLALTLSKVNHGFRGLKAEKIGGDTSGSCNIDVACTSDPTVGALIQAYADQIRSVGAYTLNGTDTCSGALINNANNDSKPYFLTAEHCGISPANAPSMVVYFNFENSSCRTPGSAASGQVGDGGLTQFNSGAIHRAENAASDFCLVELDDPIPLAYNVFYSGWDRAFTNGAATGIHHPAVAEKRISFDLDNTVDDGATHVRVLDWDHGTTEGGSSGSPLFNLAGRIIGDLTGGNAACGNDEYDSYGRISVSWTGGGTTATRLSDWLDPLSAGATSLDGVNQDDALSIDDLQLTEGNSGTQTMNFTVSLVRSSNETVTVQYQTFDGTATTPDNDYVTASGPLTFNPSDTSKTVSITINGDTTAEEHENFEVRLSSPTNAVISDGIGVGTINNDDFITPVITSTLSSTGFSGDPFSYQITASNTPSSFAISNEPAGMTVNAGTGAISWTPPSDGVFTATISATNSAGTDNETLTITVSESALQVAIDTSRVFTQSAQTWTLQTTETNDGVDAAQSPAITHDQTAFFETSVTAAAGGDALTFWWKVSSEAGFDKLRFLVNAVLIQEISGEVDWAQVSHALAGGSTSTIRIEYVKDGSVSDGSDAGWVDEFALASDSPGPTFTSASETGGAANEAFSFDVVALGATSFSATGLPTGLGIDSGTGQITGVPTALGQATATITATNGSGSTDQQLLITISPALPDALDFDTTQLTWATSGPQTWFGQSTTNHDGVDAAQSGPISDSETSTLTASMNFDGAQILSFWWKVSSESGFDFLRFNINGTANDSISGEIDWAQKSVITIPSGTQTLTWVYQKDGSASAGSDAGWIDEVVLTYKLAAPGSFSATNGTIHNLIRLNWDAVGSANSYRIYRSETNDLSTAPRIVTIPAGTLTYDDTSAVVGTSYFYWVRAHNAADQLGAAATDTGLIAPDGPMTVASIDPDRGRLGVVVTITGTNLDKTRSVKFGAIDAVFAVVSPTEITATVPSGASTGPITLTNNTDSSNTPTFSIEQTFSEWLAAQAVAAGAVLAPGTVEELAARDEDGDGASNGQEFGLGGNPFVADGEFLRSQIDDSVSPPVIRFNRAIAHLNYEIQTSTTLAEGSWVTRETNPGTVGTLVAVQLQAAWSAGGKLFARVEVSGFE